jgi:hypothetical protein
MTCKDGRQNPEGETCGNKVETLRVWLPKRRETEADKAKYEKD